MSCSRRKVTSRCSCKRFVCSSKPNTRTMKTYVQFMRLVTSGTSVLRKFKRCKISFVLFNARYGQSTHHTSVYFPSLSAASFLNMSMTSPWLCPRALCSLRSLVSGASSSDRTAELTVKPRVFSKTKTSRRSMRPVARRTWICNSRKFIVITIIAVTNEQNNGMPSSSNNSYRTSSKNSGFMFSS